MTCAQEVGDCDATLSAEVLLQRQQWHIAGEIARRGDHPALFDSVDT
jgi:hypothetical protein